MTKLIICKDHEYTWECTNCKALFDYDELLFTEFNYCPTCGKRIETIQQIGEKTNE